MGGPTVTPVACLAPSGVCVPDRSVLSEAVRNSHIICLEPSPTKNHGDITRCKQRYMIECRAGNAVGIRRREAPAAPLNDEAPNTSSRSADTLVRLAACGQEVAEALVSWFRRLRCCCHRCCCHRSWCRRCCCRLRCCV